MVLGFNGIRIAELERERQLVKERLALREREFDLMINAKPSRVQEMFSEGKDKAI